MVDNVFDTAALFAFRQRAHRLKHQGADFLLEHVVRDMAERLDYVRENFATAGITSHTAPFIAPHWLANTRHSQIIFPYADVIVHSEDHMPAFSNLNLAVSFLTLHEINDLVGALIQIKNTLAPNGLFMGVMVGGDSLFELRQSLMEAESEICDGVSPRVHPFLKHLAHCCNAPILPCP
jgi:hypothetical protein